MKHEEDCRFVEQLAEFDRGKWEAGSDQVGGGASVSLENDRIDFSDGWDVSGYIDFYFCPYCGIKLKEKLKKEV